jgi:addiction module RelB/DinJ family antitoxin
MADTTIINFRIDVDIKNKFEQFCEKVGMTPSAAINIFIRKTIDKQKIPFEIGEEEIKNQIKSDNENKTKFIQDMQDFFKNLPQLNEELLKAKEEILKLKNEKK